jgi:Peptidase propeptide and YPEB domain
MKFTYLALGAAFAIVGSSARAQAAYKREIPDSLVNAAKISEAAAAETAQKRLPNATIASVELERENGKLIYSYDMKMKGKAGVDEVNVDAVTGKIISVAHESPMTERKEAAAEAKAAKKGSTKKP